MFLSSIKVTTLCKKLTFLSLLVLFVLVSVAQAQDITPTAISTEPPTFPAADWSVADPVAHGFAPTLADDFLAGVEAMDFLSSALLVHDGAIILEYYREDVDQDTLHVTRSVTKSIVATLVGMALEEERLPGLEVTLAESLPDYYADDTYQDTADITLLNLLMMRSGLGWSDSLEHIAQIQTDPDPIAWILSSGQAVPPDSYWNYSSADAHLAGVILQAWLQEPLAAYAEAKLFTPIGITRYDWPVDQLGYNLGGADLKLTTRDMARLGYLYLNKGQWADQTVVPATWVEAMTTPQPDPAYYGYFWWLQTERNDGINIWSAVGYAGQFIMVVPDYNLVFVATSDWEVAPEIADAQSRAIRELFQNTVIPAAP